MPLVSFPVAFNKIRRSISCPWPDSSPYGRTIGFNLFSISLPGLSAARLNHTPHLLRLGHTLKEKDTTETIPLSKVSYFLFLRTNIVGRHNTRRLISIPLGFFCGMHVYPRHTWASYIQLSDRLSRPLVFKLILPCLFLQFQVFFL